MHMELLITHCIQHPLLIPLLVLTGIDYIVGILASLVMKTTSSKIGMNGIFRKILMYVSLMAVGVVSYAFTNFSYVFDVFVVFYIFNELISILENLTECGVDLPLGMFETLKEERDRLNEQEGQQ